MPITDEDILALRPRTRPYKVSIGKGAYLLVKPDGSKYWRLKYHFNGKETLRSLGVFPGVPVDAAKAARDFAKAQLLKGIKPAFARRKQKAKATPSEPLFRLGLSTKGALSILTDTHAMMFTPQQTHALAAFLSGTVRNDMGFL